MNPEIEKLIKEYLTDGIISEKERKVLLRKAEAMGLDVDEVDLYIDAQQQKVDQVIDAAAQKKRGASCPFCGGPVPQLTDKCPHCGEHITVEASKEIEELINQLEDALVGLKSGKETKKSKADVERYVRKAKLYYENNPKVNKLLGEIDTELGRTLSEQKKEAIIALCKKYWYIIVALLAVLILFFIFRPTRLNNAKICEKAVIEALKNNDPKSASQYLLELQPGSGQMNNRELTVQQVLEGLRQQNLKKELYNLASDWKGNDEILEFALKEFIKAEMLEEYAEILSTTYIPSSRRYRLLFNWVDFLLAKNVSKKEIKKIIDEQIRKFDKEAYDEQYNRDNVKKSLYKYAGIK